MENEKSWKFVNHFYINFQAFKFCEKYSRKTEFRKLCDNLRTHLSHIQKQQGSATAVNLNNPETQQVMWGSRKSDGWI